MAAQVVSGIGFLGAGTIIFRREVVRGLTTAAGLWVVSAIGLAAGAGMYVYAVGGTAGTLIILAVLKPVEARLFPHTRRLALRVRDRHAPHPAAAAGVLCGQLRPGPAHGYRPRIERIDFSHCFSISPCAASKKSIGMMLAFGFGTLNPSRLIPPFSVNPPR